jgi:hypothetical protein
MTSQKQGLQHLKAWSIRTSTEVPIAEAEVLMKSFVLILQWVWPQAVLRGVEIWERVVMHNPTMMITTKQQSRQCQVL